MKNGFVVAHTTVATVLVLESLACVVIVYRLLHGSVLAHLMVADTSPPLTWSFEPVSNSRPVALVANVITVPSIRVPWAAIATSR